MVARIFSPAKTAMQSGKGRTHNWILQFEQTQAKMIDPLMGYTSTSDVNDQIKLTFATMDEAVAYAQRHGIPFHVEEPHQAPRLRVSYPDNFRSDRQKPWTH